MFNLYTRQSILVFPFYTSIRISRKFSLSNRPWWSGPKNLYRRSQDPPFGGPSYEPYQYPEGPATGHLDTGFSWFPWVQEWMLRWFPPFQVASTRFSCSPPDLNSVVTNCLLSYYVKWPLPPGDNPTAVNKYYYYMLWYKMYSLIPSMSYASLCVFSWQVAVGNLTSKVKLLLFHICLLRCLVILKTCCH